mgnify:CR=1 FL=1
MDIPQKISNHNFFAFLWHAAFLALAQSFMDVDTIIPSMILKSGGTSFHIGIMTTILMGGSSFTQLFFAPYISNKSYKKKYLLLGINARIFSLLALAILLFFIQPGATRWALWLIFLFISMFAFGGAFTNISYTDIFGKSVDAGKRKTFFSVRQIIAGTIILLSAFLAKKIITGFNYPENYAYLFLSGGSLLLIASAGFWKINELTSSAFRISSISDYFSILGSELKNNPKIIFFLGFINTQGIIISFLPFVMLYAEQKFSIQSSNTGNYLLFKVIGIVFISLVIFLASKKIRYNFLLYLNVGLSLSIIILTMLSANATHLRYVFMVGGIVYSLFSITMNGILLEVSGKENRALYTGLAGAGNILPAVFPLAAAWIIEELGFRVFFSLLFIIVFTALFFIYKLGCKK